MAEDSFKKKSKKVKTQADPPQRSCIGCRSTFDKRRLIRLVKISNGEVEIDLSGKKSGRGAYLCNNKACWQEGLKKDRLERALHTSISREKRLYLLEYANGLNKTSEQPVSLVS